MGDERKEKEVIDLTKDVEDVDSVEGRRKMIVETRKKLKWLKIFKLIVVIPIMTFIYLEIMVFHEGVQISILAHVPAIIFLVLSLFMMIVFRVNEVECEKIIKGGTRDGKYRGS